jgi:MFS family permease
MHDGRAASNRTPDDGLPLEALPYSAYIAGTSPGGASGSNGQAPLPFAADQLAPGLPVPNHLAPSLEQFAPELERLAPSPPAPDRATPNGAAPNGAAPLPAPDEAAPEEPAPDEAATGQVTPDGQPPGPQPTGPHPPGPHPTGRHRRPPEKQASYREVFAVREFRGLWTAQLLSYAGDQFAQVAIAILVYHRTHSALLTALAYALTYLPPIFGGPLLSGLADLFPRRRVMIICDLIRAGLVAVMAVPSTPFWILCILLTCTVLLGAPFSAARSALLPDVLPGDKYVLGSAIGNMTHQASQVLGFVTGAIVVLALNPYHTLALDAGSFALSALLAVGWVKRRPAPPREQTDRPSPWTVARKGAAVVFGNPMLRSLVLFGWLAGFYVLPEGLAAPYAHALKGGTITVGLLMAAMPVGTVISAVVLGRVVKPSERLRMMGWLSMFACLPLIGCALRPPLWGVLVLWTLSGLGSGYQLAAAAAFVQNVPDSGRALAFGLAQSGLLAAQGVGILVGGAAAQVLGPAPVVALSGTAGLGCATLLAFGWTHQRGKVIADMRARADAAVADTGGADTGGADTGGADAAGT